MLCIENFQEFKSSFALSGKASCNTLQPVSLLYTYRHTCIHTYRNAGCVLTRRQLWNGHSHCTENVLYSFILLFEGSQACTLLICSHRIISLHHPLLSSPLSLSVVNKIPGSYRREANSGLCPSSRVKKCHISSRPGRKEPNAQPRCAAPGATAEPSSRDEKGALGT